MDIRKSEPRIEIPPRVSRVEPVAESAAVRTSTEKDKTPYEKRQGDKKSSSDQEIPERPYHERHGENLKIFG